MRTLKKVLILSVITISTLVSSNYRATAISISTQLSPIHPIRIVVFSKNLNDDYQIALRKNFESTQNNLNKVVFTFYDANFNKATQYAMPIRNIILYFF